MPNWLESMTQTFEYYIVDPGTWKDAKLLTTVKSSDITRDSDLETLGSASIDITDSVGECYIRIYLVTIQNGITEKHPLGTYLVQTPGTSFDGKVQSVSMDAYTPLLELKEKQPPLGYSIFKDENVMDYVYRLSRENMRAPVVSTKSDIKLFSDFVAQPDDNWITFIRDLAAYAKYELDLDEMGRLLFSPKQDTASLQPVWTYNDDNSSILQPAVSVNHDMYGIPNVVEVIYSTTSEYYYAKAVNDDPNSPTSTVSRGREIPHRISNPDVMLVTNESDAKKQRRIQEYAEQTLRELSSAEYTITYTHGYCPVRRNDCVRLNYKRAGLTDIKARVISQSIKCESGCQVTETAVFTKKLWG